MELAQLNQQDVRLAEGWYLLAKLQSNLKHGTDAHEAYYRSMQYAATPFAARARYQLAMEEAERKHWDKAAEILLPNLEMAAQDREAHEKSLYELSWILVQKQDYCAGRVLS